MGSVAGCTKKCFLICNIKDIITIDQKSNIENLYTVVNTNKNEQTKPALIENGNYIVNRNNSEEDYQNLIEEENHQDLIEEDNKEDYNEEQNEENNKEEEEKEEEEEKKENVEEINQKEFMMKTSNTNINKNGIIKKTSTKVINVKPIENVNVNDTAYQRSNTINISANEMNKLKDKIRKYEYHTTIIKLSDIENGEKGENGKNGKENNDGEEIISVNRPFVSLQGKKSSRMLINFQSLDALKSSILQKSLIKESNKQTLLKISGQNQNYMTILNDFGEKRGSLFQYNKNTKRIFLSNKEKRDKNYKKKNFDDIKGNFMLKNEKIIRYQGGFVKKSKKKNGFGIITWSDLSTLHGIYNSNSINGIARFYNNKYKSTFIGEYRNNIPNGFGVYHIKSLSMQGYWYESKLNGIVIEVWDDGTYYQGEYENNKKNGIGLYRWPDGTIYQGEFNNGQISGRGIIYNSDDSVFSGELLNGYMNGYGVFTWSSGAIYMGNYLQDIKHGFGIYIWDSKVFICYIGFWEMGKQHGIGVKVNGNKVKYCVWKKGKITVTLKGLYEIDRYLSGLQKGYYKFFTSGYIAKLRASTFYSLNPK